MARPARTGTGVEAAWVAYVGTASLAVTLVHGVALVPGGAAAGSAGASAMLTVTTLIVAAANLAVAQTPFGRTRPVLRAAAFAACGAAYLLLSWHTAAAATALFGVGLVQPVAARVVAARVDPFLGGALRRRPVVCALWGVLGVLLVVQSARLGTFMADPSTDWWLTTRDPLWAKHMCMPAYVEGADLQRQGIDNIYDSRYYLVMNRSARPPLTVRRMDEFAGDPYQYPPQFLLVPRLGLALTDDFLALRNAWYVLQTLLFVAVALALSTWIGGRTGLTAALLIPVVWLSIPGIQSLQYGQFQMAAIACALAAMVAFDRQRNAGGGFLLSIAIFAKIFPAILLVWLAAQRRWRALGWTLAAGGVITLLALAVLGPQPFVAFVRYQVPRLADGSAFDFAREWPELRLMLIIGNLSPAAVAAKLHELGVAGISPAAGLALLRLYTVALLIVAFVASRAALASREQAAIVWLALLNLAALQSYGAWGDYVTLGAVWLLTVSAVRDFASPRRLGRLLLVGSCWVLFVFVPGVQPIPSSLPATLALVLTTAVAIALLAFNATVLFAPSRRPSRCPPIDVVPEVSG